MAEPSARAARLGYLSGTVSFAPAGQSDWVQATFNRPVTTGDRLWIDANSRAELQVGGAAIRVGASTSVAVLNLDDRMTQLQLSQGTLKLRVRGLRLDQSFEVDTPNLAFTLRRPGEYRVDVDPNGDSTAVMVQSGEAEVYGNTASYAVTPLRGYRFYGTDLSDYDSLAPNGDDDLDRWSRERDRRGDRSSSARYVSGEVVGYEDLDANGTWRADPNYGNVWTPSRVPAGWTPYHDGHWAWVDPWGWTWVDDAPWGYAVSHYGRWANMNGSWGWVPGPPHEQAVYAPALVVFIGGENFQPSLPTGVAAASVGWFPLAPREVYRPSYQVSKAYFDNINRSNAVIAPATITNIYNTVNVTNNTTVINKTSNVVYANRQVAGAVVAVPAQAFAQSQSVAKTALPISKAVAMSAPIAVVAAVAPVLQSVHGGAPNAGAKPSAREPVVVARTAPPAPPIPFAAQQTQLAAKPGTPIDDTRRTQLKPAMPPAMVPNVSVVATTPVPTPTALPPPTPPAGKSPEARKVEAAKIEATRVDAVKADAGKPNAAKADVAKADASKADAAKLSAANADATKAVAAKADAVKADSAKADAARATTATADAAKTNAAKLDAAKVEAARAATAKGEAAKVEAARADATTAEAAKAEALRVDAARAAAAKAEAARTDAAKAATAKAEAAKADVARADATKAEAAKAEASRVDAARAAAAKAESARTDAAKAATAKAEAAKADAARVVSVKPPAAALPPPEAHASAPKSAAEVKVEQEKKRAEEEARKH
jgi:hypothetical protein